MSMELTKRLWEQPTDKGVLAYHIIQSFSPGEATPDQVHEIGCEFARRFLADRFECTVSTHLDKGHLHNHIVVNSVSYADGKMFRNNFDTYYHGIRQVSDELCRENRLSVIETDGKGKSYDEWLSGQTGKPTIRGMVRKDVEQAIAAADSFDGFITELQNMGYTVKYGPRVEHMAVRHKDAQRNIRIDRLDPRFSETALREYYRQLHRMPTEMQQEYRQENAPEKPKWQPTELQPPVQRVRYRGKLPRRYPKVSGFMACYYHYCALLRKAYHGKSTKRCYFLLREDFLLFSRYQQQTKFLWENHIETMDELLAYKENAEVQIQQLARQRKVLYKHNLNIIVIGGSGSGKTRFYVKPNALQLIGSYLFLDPKGELTRTLGRIMEAKGIHVTVLDLVHFQGHYNPMAYLETDEDAIKLAFAIVNNTKPKDAPSGGDKFWDDSSVLLISALILYLMYEAPASEQNFSTLMYMILNCQVSENEMVENPLMMLFGELERRDPQHPAVLQFKSFMLGAKKTLQSILISAAANLYMFNSRKFAEMTSRDEMFLPRMGLEQRALFIVLPDNDTTFNFIATMLYTQLFDQLFRLADSTPEYNGALPVHVRLMMDEFANVALPKNFKNILAVCRSRNISCDIILQNIAQLKSLFKDDWEGIIGNCDTLLYLGGNEYGTYEYLSKILGKETERTKSQSIGKGSRGSSSDSLQTAGRELCMPDEIRRMRDDECLLLMRSEDPVIDRKYNLLKHPNVKYTPDAGGEPYVMPPDYMGDAATITMDAVAAATAPEITEEMYEQLDYLEKHPEENYYENEESFSQYDQGE